MGHSVYTSKSDSNYTENVKLALKNGCQWIQISMNETPEEEAVRMASSIKNLCDEYHAYLIIEDRVDLAKQVKANGVHLNEKSNVATARKELGARYLICVDAADCHEANELRAMGADCTDEQKFGYKSFACAFNGLSPVAYA